MHHRRLGPVALGALLALMLARPTSTSTQIVNEDTFRHSAGQSVTPSFEGWFKNADGTFSLLFGYMNRNFDEELDIPIGPSNKIEPGAPDQGQPTHFLTRRHVGVFTITVPSDFAKQQIKWTLVSNKEVITIPGHLRPEW